MWKAGDQRLASMSTPRFREERQYGGGCSHFSFGVGALLVNYVIYYMLSENIISLPESLFPLWPLSESKFFYKLQNISPIGHPDISQRAMCHGKISGSHIFSSLCLFLSALRSSSVFNMLPGVCSKCCSQHTLTFVISGGPMQHVLSNQGNIWFWRLKGQREA